VTIIAAYTRGLLSDSDKDITDTSALHCALLLHSTTLLYSTTPLYYATLLLYGTTPLYYAVLYCTVLF
jgi:hypothetical protein